MSEENFNKPIYKFIDINYIFNVFMFTLVDFMCFLFWFTNVLASRMLALSLSLVLVSIVRVIVTYAFGIYLGLVISLFTAVACILLIITTKTLSLPIQHLHIHNTDKGDYDES